MWVTGSLQSVGPKAMFLWPIGGGAPAGRVWYSEKKRENSTKGSDSPRCRYLGAENGSESIFRSVIRLGRPSEAQQNDAWAAQRRRHGNPLSRHLRGSAGRWRRAKRAEKRRGRFRRRKF
ncbi:hypothetical protein SKAU_G00242700 [Synaphobranchus kaupii]|uniref:Uncharacterized protein n=1 Tax=Synaphobranchus kaupii TaxID=118154 RepID=A0A9Q1IUD9_SYNKA|nr:hypothetical protein SKAU_G00242700 [Synaphobranchus kaupii]